MNDQSPKDYYDGALILLKERMYTFDEWNDLDADSQLNVTRD